MQIRKAVRPKGAPQKYHVYVDPGDGLVHAQNNRTGITDHTGATADVVLAALLTDLGSTVATATLSDETHNLAADVTIPATVGVQAVQGTLFKPASGKGLTLNGHLDAGPYQIFDLSAGGSVALGPGAARRIHPEWVGAKADNSTDNATPFANWKALVPARGGRGELQQGVYKTSGTLLVPSYTRLEGTPGSIGTGGTGDPLSGSCLLWTGAANGTVLSFFDSLLSGARGININGGGIAGVTGVLFDSDNNPISELPSLEHFSIYNCGVPGTSGVGVRVGSSAVTNYQADTWRLARGIIKNNDTGADLRSLNANYQGIIEQVKFIGHRYGIRPINVGNNVFRVCAFGGHTTYTVADIYESSDGAGNGGGGAQVLVETCQTEKNANGTTWFLKVDASCTPNLTLPYTFINNRITDCGILLNQTRILELKGGNQFWACNVIVGGGNPVIYDEGTVFAGVGMRNVTDLVTTSGSATISSATAAFVSTDVGKRICDPTSGSGGIAAAGIPLGALIATVVNGTTVTMADANGNAILATATATGVSARFDYGFVVPRNTGELISNSLNPTTDFPQQTFHTRANADVVRVTSVNPAVSFLGFGVDARVAGGHHWQMVAGGATDPGAFYLLDGAARVVSVNPNLNTDQLNVNAWGIAVVGGYARSQTAVKTSAYTATPADGTILCDPTSAGFTVTFPSNTALLKGRRYTVVNASASTNTITVAFNDGSTINGAATTTLAAAWGHLTIEANGTNKWYVVG